MPAIVFPHVLPLLLLPCPSAAALERLNINATASGGRGGLGAVLSRLADLVTELTMGGCCRQAANPTRRQKDMRGLHYIRHCTGASAAWPAFRRKAGNTCQLCHLPAAGADDGEAEPLAVSAIAPMHGPVVRQSLTELVRRYG